MDNLKETAEMVDVVFDIAAQAIQSGQDGFDLADLASFFDEFTDIPRAVTGLVGAFATEVGRATVADIEILFEDQRAKLTDSGLDDKAAALVVSGLKTVFHGLSLGFEQGRKEVDPTPEQPAPGGPVA